MAYQYKTSSGGTATNIPTAALEGTYDGTFATVYPEPQSRAGTGEPCAAIGKPAVVIHSRAMTDTGMSFWRGILGTVTTTASTQFWLQAPNARAGSATWWTGYLLQPVYSRVSIGSTAGNTVYYDVQIRIESCTAV